MSQFSEVIGSFLRKGSFPLEADYVFKTEESLKNYYSDPENNAILHRGLLKVVEDDGTGNQALYWVVNSDSGLTFTKLISSNGMGTLEEDLENLQKQIEKEIQDRKDADNTIWGAEDPTNIPEDLNSILDLSEAIKSLRQEIEDKLEVVDNMKEEVKALAGTKSEDVIAFLNTLDYKSISDLSNKLHSFLNNLDSSSTSIDTWKELSNFLTEIKDSDTLKGLLDKNLNTILGDPIPSTEFSTLRNIEEFVRKELSSINNSYDNLKKEIDDTQTGAGLDASGAYSPAADSNYLKDSTSIMSALKILDDKLAEFASSSTFYTTNPDVIELDIIPEKDKTRINGILKVSTEAGNLIRKADDGLIVKYESTYEDGILTVKINDQVVAQHVIGQLFKITDQYYDPTTESIVIIFTTADKTQSTVRIPVHTLIREWTTDNSGPSDTVILTRTEDFTGGPDKLSGDVRIFPHKYNILTKRDNALFVKGTSDNIFHEDGKLSTIIDELKQASSDASESVTEIDNTLKDHLRDYENPHKTTAEQVGTYDKEHIDNLVTWNEVW